MKIAIVCDWLVTLGGAEKFLSHLLKSFPQADLFAVIDFVEPGDRHLFLNKAVQTTFLQSLPFVKKFYRHCLPLMPLAIEQLDLSSYDIIFSSSHAVAKGVITGPDQIHISYVHSPMRYAWDLQHQYLKETGLDKRFSGLIARWFLHRLRLWDYRSAQGVDYLLANSHFIKKRIEKTYRRNAKVIYPPVDVQDFTLHKQKENFYLTASRFVPYKKIDLIVEAFRDMPEKELIVIGDGPDFQKVKAKCSDNVKLLGFQTKDKLIYYMQRAKAFLFAAEEDFGLVPVEAQSCGTPVIAFGKGGALETVRDLNHAQPTGVFFNDQTPDAIHDAIRFFESNITLFTPENCLLNAKQFAPEIFHKQITDFVQEKWLERQRGDQTSCHPEEHSDEGSPAKTENFDGDPSS